MAMEHREQGGRNTTSARADTPVGVGCLMDYLVDLKKRYEREAAASDSEALELALMDVDEADGEMRDHMKAIERLMWRKRDAEAAVKSTGSAIRVIRNTIDVFQEERAQMQQRYSMLQRLQRRLDMEEDIELAESMVLEEEQE